MWPAGGDHALQDAQVWQWGSGNGGLQTCEAGLYMGLASPRWGGGEVGSTPTPCVDAAVANWGFIM